jgi:hypothetical protein
MCKDVLELLDLLLDHFKAQFSIGVENSFLFVLNIILNVTSNFPHFLQEILNRLSRLHIFVEAGLERHKHVAMFVRDGDPESASQKLRVRYLQILKKQLECNKNSNYLP